jgi:hypothetical protein
MAGAEREPIWGSEVKPPVGSRGKAPGQGVQGLSLLKLTAVACF